MIENEGEIGFKLNMYEYEVMKRWQCLKMQKKNMIMKMNDVNQLMWNEIINMKWNGTMNDYGNYMYECERK